jgi:hypothetical protein
MRQHAQKGDDIWVHGKYLDNKNKFMHVEMSQKYFHVLGETSKI